MKIYLLIILSSAVSAETLHQWFTENKADLLQEGTDHFFQQYYDLNLSAEQIKNCTKAIAN